MSREIIKKLLVNNMFCYFCDGGQNRNDVSVDFGVFWIGCTMVSFQESGTVLEARLELTMWVMMGQTE